MEILNQILDFTKEYCIFFVLGLAIIVIIMLIYVAALNGKVRKIQYAYDDFMKGKDGRSLEEILKKVLEDNKKVKQQCKYDVETIANMKKDVKETYRKIGIMKYDTFRGMSGKLSFSLALLDGDDSGFVLSCMHSQDGCYSYLKEIIHGESHAILSNEERDALNMALNSDMEGEEALTKKS